MTNLRSRSIAAMALFFAGITAHAFTVELDGTSATGIRDLDIAGTAYNVVFEFVQADTADTVACAPGVPCDIFFGDELAAEAATDAVNAAMNSWTPFPTTVGSSTNISYFVPWDKSGGQVNVSSSQATIVAEMVWLRVGDADLDGTDIIEYARFSVVPVPAAVWLFGSALAILGWIRRRISKASLR